MLNWKGEVKSPKVQEEEVEAARTDDPACDVCNGIDHPELDVGYDIYDCNPTYCDYTDEWWPQFNTCRPKDCCADRSCSPPPT